VVLIKDAAGRVIGFEKLNFPLGAPAVSGVAFETVG